MQNKKHTMENNELYILPYPIFELNLSFFFLFFKLGPISCFECQDCPTTPQTEEKGRSLCSLMDQSGLNFMRADILHRNLILNMDSENLCWNFASPARGPSSSQRPPAPRGLRHFFFVRRTHWVCDELQSYSLADLFTNKNMTDWLFCCLYPADDDVATHVHTDDRKI